MASAAIEPVTLANSSAVSPSAPSPANISSPHPFEDGPRMGNGAPPTGDVNCIFLCEFHAIAGPKITLQVPNDYVSKDLFRIVNPYIIPKVPLQKSFLSISMLGTKILGYPIRIENKIYARNTFHFNLCFVFQPTTRTIGYEPVVKKLTEYLISLELSGRLLSQIQMPEHCERVRQILSRVLHDINRDKMCLLQEGFTTIPLCVVSHYQETFPIGAHLAPVLIENFFRHKKDQWDLTTLRILPFINGFNHIQKISALGHVDTLLVKECIKHLVILKVALLVPVFQYNNMYRPTPRLSMLAKCVQMQKRCLEKCSIKQKRCSVRDVFRMFASMAHGATFGEICVRFNPSSLNINDRQMVLFGLVEGLIRIVNKYPVSVKRNLFGTTGFGTTTVAASTLTTTQSETIEEEPEESCNGGDEMMMLMGMDGGGGGEEESGRGGSISLINEHPKTASIFNSFEQDEIYPHSLIADEGRKSVATASKPLPRSGNELTKQKNLVQILKKFYTNYYDMQKKCNSSRRIADEQLPGIFFYTGAKSFDELSCAIGFSNHEMDNLLSRDKHCIVLFK